MHPNRYVLDPLYGVITPPSEVWRVFSMPELQRLREVRLCNINSLCLTGAGIVNRFEHALGTAYLAEQCIKAGGMLLPPNAARRIMLAALLHDVKSAPFGHSVQYVLEPSGYRHESLDGLSSFAPPHYGFEHWTSTHDRIFFGRKPALKNLVALEDQRAIDEMMAGKGPYGPLISGNGIDLDNIDNVYRMAYHMGLSRDVETPVRLARGLRLANGRLEVEPAVWPLVENWYRVRRRLYEYLLLNPDEFSAKCMLQEAVEEAIVKHPESRTDAWHESDHELLRSLIAGDASMEQKERVARLMTGELYGCLAIYATPTTEVYPSCSLPLARHAAEQELSGYLRSKGGKHDSVALHFIKDVNKTQRRIELYTTEGEKRIVGTPTNRLLVGVFLRNVGKNMNELPPEPYSVPVMNGLREVLGRALAVNSLTELSLFQEARLEPIARP